MPPALAVNYAYVAYSGTATYVDSSQSLERAFRPVPEPDDAVARAIKAAGDDGAAVLQRTKQSARLLLDALSDRPAPEVTASGAPVRERVVVPLAAAAARDEPGPDGSFQRHLATS